jgi:hypothetical protein
MSQMLDATALAMQNTPTKMSTARVDAKNSHAPLLADDIHPSEDFKHRQERCSCFFVADVNHRRTSTINAIVAHIALSATEAHAFFTLRYTTNMAEPTKFSA